MYSLIIPVYKNEGSIPELLAQLELLNQRLSGKLHVSFVVDASPDRSYALLSQGLPSAKFKSSLLLLSRNFGSFGAIRAGLAEAPGPYFAVMAADLQEPTSLIESFFKSVEANECDVAVGTREGRNDPFFSRIASAVFWKMYRSLVQNDIPPGGVDVFGCNLVFRDRLVALGEANSTLVGLIFWLGFRRKTFGYTRLARRHGRSAWTVKAKLRYLTNSLFAFSDLPLRILGLLGFGGMSLSLFLALFILVAKTTGHIAVPGYTATVLTVIFFGGLNSFGLGLLGSYLWRTFENSKSRPLVIVMNRTDFNWGDENGFLQA